MLNLKVAQPYKVIWVLTPDMMISETNVVFSVMRDNVS